MGAPAKRYIPEGYHSITPYLIVRGAAKAIDFYKRAFNATELVRMPLPDGRVGHAELRMGNSVVMLSDEMPDMRIVGPETIGGTSVGFCLYVEDCDAVFKQAIQSGARQDRPMENQFYGDRSGTVIDPFGHKWTVATHKEDVTPEEMRERMAAQKK
jgi:PhnB protein